MRANIEQHAWDGGWYLRAFYDDGTPLGSASSEECKIDSVAQSWSVLSGAGSTERALAAMDAMNQRLVKREAGLVQLLDPPFDAGVMDPGYIRGYVPGVRENGGQYTHGAIWAAMAFAALGDAEHAWDILRLIIPINHGDSSSAIARYRVEPYVVAADVYALAPHTGRGGWSWYTGSAGWMYQLILESLLGVHREGDRLRFAPCLPRTWPSCEIRYRFADTWYHILLRQDLGIGAGPKEIRVWHDGIAQTRPHVTLIDDHRTHHIEVNVAMAPVLAATVERQSQPSVVRGDAE